MQKGKQLGEYSFKSTSNRVREDGRLEINCEGTVTGFGFVVNTLTVTVGDGKSGQYDVHECATATMAPSSLPAARMACTRASASSSGPRLA